MLDIELADVIGSIWFCIRVRHDPDDWHEAGILSGKVVVAWRAPDGEGT